MNWAEKKPLAERALVAIQKCHKLGLLSKFGGITCGVFTLVGRWSSSFAYLETQWPQPQPIGVRISFDGDCFCEFPRARDDTRDIFEEGPWLDDLPTALTTLEKRIKNKINADIRAENRARAEREMSKADRDRIAHEKRVAKYEALKARASK